MTTDYFFNEKGLYMCRHCGAPFEPSHSTICTRKPDPEPSSVSQQSSNQQKDERFAQDLEEGSHLHEAGGDEF